MIVNVVPNADPAYALVEGIQSDRALSILIRAVMDWYAFGRYNYVVVDLTSFDDWSPRVVDGLANAVSTAAGAGHWLAFFPVNTYWLRGTAEDRFHAYPDLTHAQRAMRQNWYAATANSGKRHRRRCQDRTCARVVGEE
jgi:hypothetical protein